MTNEERELICREIAILSMWGHGWVGSSLMDRLDKRLPGAPTWDKLYHDIADNARRDHVGRIDDEAALKWWMQRGYWLTNWDDKGCSLFNPPPMNGLCKYVSKELAEKYKSPWASAFR